MKKKILSFVVIVWCGYGSLSAQENFKVMFYNLLNYPLEDAVPNREDDLEFILTDYQPDLFLVCELNNSTGADNVLNIVRDAVTTDFEMATYVSNTSDDTAGDQNDLQNQLYYNSRKFILEEEIIVPTDLRDFNIYKVKLNSVDQITNPVEIYIVVCHLKASSGVQNQQRRFNMVVELNNYLSTLPTNINVLIGGDLNLYSANEPAFQFLLQDSNNITFVDPPNRIGSWNNNTNFIDVFTQSTRTQTGLGGTTGGFDDRFDFILTSDNMMGNSNINYVADSYEVYGNNGLESCYNRRINSSDCGIPSSTYSFEVRDALHNFSDHLPVIVELEANVTLSTQEVTEQNKGIQLEKSITNSSLGFVIKSAQYLNTKFNIYNAIGQKVKQFKTNTDPYQSFNISNLANGTYFIEFNTQDETTPLKFVITD